MPQGSVNLTITSDGFGANSTIFYTINDTSFFNTSVNMAPSSVSIYVFDEKSLSAMTFNVTFTNSTMSKTWTNITNLSQSYSNLTLGDTTITVSSAGYTTRNYYLTINSQTLENISAYLLQTGLGQTVRFHIVTTSETAISDVLTVAQKLIGSTYETVEEAKSDSSGTATMFLDPTVTYQMVFSHPSYQTMSTSVEPSGTDYKVYLSSTSTINLTYPYGDVGITLLPSQRNLVNLTSQAFNLTLNTSIGTLSNWGWNITSGTTSLYSNNFSTTTGGTDSVTLNLNGVSGEL